MVKMTGMAGGVVVDDRRFYPLKTLTQWESTILAGFNYQTGAFLEQSHCS
jgi:hypothetical protein